MGVKGELCDLCSCKVRSLEAKMKFLKNQKIKLKKTLCVKCHQREKVCTGGAKANMS